MAEERFFSQFRNSPIMKALARGFARELKKTNDTITELLTKRTIDAAEGEQAKRNAQIVGLNLTGFPDAVIRGMTKVAILINRASGEPNRMMEVASKLGQNLNGEGITSPLVVGYAESYPANVMLTVFGYIAARFRRYFKTALLRTKPAGVRLDVVNATGTGTPFGYGSLANPTPPGIGGYASLANPTFGGEYAALI